MAKKKRQPGQNTRNLAFRRRVRAMQNFGAAGAVLLFPFVFVFISHSFLSRHPTYALNPTPPIQLPIALYFFLATAAISLIVNGFYLWKRANHADQGAKGEEKTAQELQPLTQAGWQIEFGLLMGNWGDVDIVCLSPHGQAYVIDVKSHQGIVLTDGKRLIRQMGKTTYPFEKDFLEQAMKQALRVKQQKQLKFVTPIVAFSDAKVSVPAGKLRGVYVVEKARLVPLLKTLSRSRTES